ncbi:MAG: uncharacterized protein JWQ90_4751 [Hydrocarboniphaga sp.]|uniref:DUF6285 domain-containing protein n=1 Tax=Hydrocarboniphaga sp. TaxID=2033016 RepID=UPI002639B3C4|nr:DUF6285 domain-containing protein [Hydrocarboniphaga sp.]MDB5972301.1 uncharacterized protein [Hydrocarboniphaga sp.]
MQDAPTPVELLSVVADFLSNEVLPLLHGATAFQLRVAINALSLVQRETSLAQVQAPLEHARLRALLGHDGSLQELTAALAQGIADGRLDVASPDLAEHLWQTTCDKLEVDQPKYAGYVRALQLHAAARRRATDAASS